MVQKSGDHQLRMVVYPIIYKVLYNPGAAGCLPSTVWNHRLCRNGASHSSHGACDVYTFIMYGYALASRMLVNVESFVTWSKQNNRCHPYDEKHHRSLDSHKHKILYIINHIQMGVVIIVLDIHGGLYPWPTKCCYRIGFRKEIVVKCCKHLLLLHFNPYIIVCSSNKLNFFGKNTNLLSFQMFLFYPWTHNSNLLLQTSYDMYLAEQLHGTWFISV